jgi:sugar phosphate isomerase/epimerase
MKLSCLPVSFFKAIINGQMTITQWSKFAASIGLDGTDLTVLFFKERNSKYLTAMRKEVEDAGIEVVLINTYPDLTHPDTIERKRQQAQLQTDIADAALAGAKMIRVTAGQGHPQTGRTDGVSWAVEGLKLALGTAERAKVKLVYENHSKPGVWQYADFSLTTDIFLEIADQLKGTAMGILFDTANPLVYGDDPLPILEQVIDRVLCIHAADTHKRGILEPARLGTGLVPFKPIFTRLRRAGFEGWISMEEASNLGEAGVRDAANFVRQTWANSG